MDQEQDYTIKAQSAVKSRTVQLLLSVLVAYAVKNFGVPFMPSEVQIAATEILTVAIPILVTGAIWFRVKARTVIDSWWH
jgi:hypothetical protein